MKRLSLYVFSFLMMGGGYFAKAQSGPDTTKNYTAHAPKKAALMSAIVPGLGQIYNRKYWKVPVIYVGVAGLAYSYKFSQDRYSTYKKAYVKRTDGDAGTTDEYVGKYSDDNLLTLKDYYRRNRDLTLIFSGALYVLNIVDASVDAHLFYFDVSDKLSMELVPSAEIAACMYSGISLRLFVR